MSTMRPYCHESAAKAQARRRTMLTSNRKGFIELSLTAGAWVRHLTKQERLRFLLAAVVVAAFLHRFFEIPDAFAQALAQIGQLARPKEQERNRYDEQKMQRLE